MRKLSVVIATRNEEINIADCINSVKEISDEIIVVDESSTDKTVEIAQKLGAKVFIVKHEVIFHITKQIALEKAQGDWILQLDADERISPRLAKEIKEIMDKTSDEIDNRVFDSKKKKLFERHQKLLGIKDGGGEYAGFFIPRENLFLGKYLHYGGVYPDGVIRLVKRGKAHFPAKSVHEQIAVDGRIGWLQNSLYHIPDSDFRRYLRRNSYYIDLIANELKEKRVGKNPIKGINYFITMPLYWFFLTQIRHKGILDGWQGIVFSFFSALRFPRAYWRYLIKRY